MVLKADENLEIMLPGCLNWLVAENRQKRYCQLAMNNG